MVFLMSNFLISLVLVSTSDGKTSEYFGVIVTSSKVSASFMGSIMIYIRFFLKLKSLSFNVLQIIKLSLDSFLLDLGLKTLTSLKIFFPKATISLNDDPKNILETKRTFFNQNIL